jgi:hypothetical protein
MQNPHSLALVAVRDTRRPPVVALVVGGGTGQPTVNQEIWAHFFIGSLSHSFIDEDNPAILQWPNDSMTQFFEQRFRLLQIFGVEAFGEPIVDLG